MLKLNLIRFAVKSLGLLVAGFERAVTDLRTAVDAPDPKAASAAALRSLAGEFLGVGSRFFARLVAEANRLQQFAVGDHQPIGERELHVHGEAAATLEKPNPESQIPKPCS